MRRTLGYLAFLPLASRVPMYAGLFVDLVRDPRIPAARKSLLAGALGYLAVRQDAVPDDIPILGGLDDLVVVVLALDLFLDGVPAPVLEERLAERGIDRMAFDRDVAQVRRLLPRPVRATIRRIPEALGAAQDFVRSSGVGSRLRAWINKEGSIA